MTDDVSIRTASDADVRDFVEDRDERHYFLDHLGNGRGILLFAFRDRVFAGHIFLRLEPAEELELRGGLPGVPLLQHLRVTEQHRRSGIARLLLREAERRLLALGHRRVALVVHPENRHAINLYRGQFYTAWRNQELTTFREHVHDDGSIRREPEPYLVFVKALGPPPT